MSTIALIAGQPGWLEITIILLVLVLLFGARRLPELARSMGKSISEFKKGRIEGASEETSSADEESKDKTDA